MVEIDFTCWTVLKVSLGDFFFFSSCLHDSFLKVWGTLRDLLINVPSMTASVKMESLSLVGGAAGGLICSARFLRPHANEGKNTDQSSCHGELSNSYDALLEFLRGLTNDFPTSSPY